MDTILAGQILEFAAGQTAELSFGQIIISAFMTSDIVGKAIVAILIFTSVISWSIIANKFLAVRQSLSSCDKFQKRYDSVSSPLSMGLYLSGLKGPMKNICAAGLRELFEICNISERNKEPFMRTATMPRNLSTAEIDKIRSSMNRQINQESLELDESLGCLSVFVTASPFMGLLGTVWGVMATFTNIATMGSIEISKIAPGISGALLTTVAGLIVAIPAVVSNIIINERINKINLRMDIFLEDFIASLKLEDAGEEGQNSGR